MCMHIYIGIYKHFATGTSQYILQLKLNVQ